MGDTGLRTAGPRYLSQLSAHIIHFDDQVEPATQVQQVEPTTGEQATAQAPPQAPAPSITRENRRVRFEDGGEPGQSTQVPTVTIPPSNGNIATVQDLNNDIEPQASSSSSSSEHNNQQERVRQRRPNARPTDRYPPPRLATDLLAFSFARAGDSITPEEIQALEDYELSRPRRRHRRPNRNSSSRPTSNQLPNGNPPSHAPTVNNPPITLASNPAITHTPSFQPNGLSNFDFFAPTWHPQYHHHHTTTTTTSAAAAAASAYQPPPFPHQPLPAHNQLYYINGNGNPAALPPSSYLSQNRTVDPRIPQLTAITRNPFLRSWYLDPRLPDSPRQPDIRDGELQALVNRRYGVSLPPPPPPPPVQPPTLPPIVPAPVSDLSIGNPALALPGEPDGEQEGDALDLSVSIQLAGVEVTLEDIRNAPLVEVKEDYSGSNSDNGWQDFEALGIEPDDGNNNSEDDEKDDGDDDDGKEGEEGVCEVKEEEEEEEATAEEGEGKKKRKFERDEDDDDDCERSEACKLPRLV
ncbi:hypothetical protein AA313_de0209315 [Arthrobotrys entomopaga]|nr:hypothetical protein AA313_de0209315 [Arthrobotrys entomopaga]